jgi:osmotically-inducible protein OsmY
VTLTGEVLTAEEETQALRLARNTNGVTNVVDQLRVAPDPASTGTSGLGEPGPLVTDASITVDVKAKLMADPDTSGLRIDVDTAGRVVTLTGTVKSQAEKDEALRLAREATGVTSVTDRLTVERRK